MMDTSLNNTLNRNDTGSIDAGEQPLLQVRNLKVQFITEQGIVKAVNDISFDVRRSETLGFVGESGCGKSITMLSILRLIECPPGRISGGAIVFDGMDLFKTSSDEMRRLRGDKIAMIFQDPMTSLNPVFTIGEQIMEAIHAHQDISKNDARQRAIDLLEMVGIPQPARAIDDYPHQFSGGMRQRAMIAMALSCEPSLLIADEPTTALDVTVQEQLLDLMSNLQKRLGMALIWITHDLGVVAGVADRINVMYAGKIIETGSACAIFDQPRHPYTSGLLNSIPRLDVAHRRELVAIKGAPPDLIHLPRGCAFAPRCRYVIQKCREEIPSLAEVEPAHFSACWVNPPFSNQPNPSEGKRSGR